MTDKSEVSSGNNLALDDSYINFRAINNVLDAKIVLKTHSFKIFRFLYRSFVSVIRT